MEICEKDVVEVFDKRCLVIKASTLSSFNTQSLEVLSESNLTFHVPCRYVTKNFGRVKTLQFNTG